MAESGTTDDDTLDQDISHDREDTFEARRFTAFDGRIIAMYARGMSGCRAYSACSSASRTKSVVIDELTRQPTIRRANTSITNVT
jgi:hypothetical protein